MSAIDAVTRIQEIQQTFAVLQSGGFPQAAATASGSFTGALASALASTQPDAMTAGATSGSMTVSGSVTGQAIVADAKKYLGVPYVFGGTTSAGMDCSGLVQTVLKDLGISSPRLVSGEATLGTAVPSLADAQPGDLIVLKNNEHIVIYAGDGKVIHAPDVGRTVSEVPNWLTDADIETIRRIAPTPGTATAVHSPASALSSSQVTQLLSAIQGSL
ncbi:C40 family peptidase [Diaminobutyricibacter tongyongensis]|uniref:C40 family peptidase n=1 Tax=Leifsonia tongyongensis TaxID=1268043 RepID=A0A6L9XV60_9MICO|nr:C40 family peptidase [Diaminobutyricibacter tongyongensis]NEN05186.1 C40 family peptidase [Diaminobutyricibacter tongyongensis]